jgi:hypothetical protein
MATENFTPGLTDAELLAEIQRNVDVQKRNPFDSDKSVAARISNRAFMEEAAARNLKGEVR